MFLSPIKSRLKTLLQYSSGIGNWHASWPWLLVGAMDAMALSMMLFSVLLALGLIKMPGTEISRLPMGVSILVVLLWKWLF